MLKIKNHMCRLMSFPFSIFGQNWSSKSVKKFDLAFKELPELHNIQSNKCNPAIICTIDMNINDLLSLRGNVNKTHPYLILELLNNLRCFFFLLLSILLSAKFDWHWVKYKIMARWNARLVNNRWIFLYHCLIWGFQTAAYW